MIPSSNFQQEYKNPKLSQPQKQSPNDLLMIQKSLKINLSKLNIESIRDLHPAFNNTFICVDYINNNNKRLIHFTVDAKLLGELPLKQNQYLMFMLSGGFVNFVQYSDRKPILFVSQWNLQTHDVIVINLNREITPLVKLFSFTQSQTFCVCQYDKHGQPKPPSSTSTSTSTSQPLPSHNEQPACYHTKYKLSYFKFPLRKPNQKPCVVFKTHTNLKQYGYYQQIIKLNDHSMVGSISNKMDENDQTTLKTFDFRNIQMGIQINYKFHVHVNYRKEILQLWITDMWEMKPDQFYLKCQLRLDRGKEEKYVKQFNKQYADLENIQEVFHLTWAYKNQSTIKFAKFKTPFLNSIQFLDSFRQKERTRVLYQRTLVKQKNVKIQQPFYPLLTNHSSQPLIQPISIIQPSSNSMLQPLCSSTSSTASSSSILQSQKSQVVNSQPYFHLTKSVHMLPIYYINNTTQEIMLIDREFSDWMCSYPAYLMSTVFYFKYPSTSSSPPQSSITVNPRDPRDTSMSAREPSSRENAQKSVEIVMQKKKQNYTYRQLQMFLLNQLVQDCDVDLGKKVYGMMDGTNKIREIQNGWYYLEASKIYRENKSKSSYEMGQYKC